MKRIIFALVLGVIVGFFLVGIAKAEKYNIWEKEVLTELQKELIKNTVWVHNFSVNKKHIVINNFPKDSLSPIVFMATWIFDVDSIIKDRIKKVTYLYIVIYNSDKFENPNNIFIVLMPMIWKKGPFKGQKGMALIGYNYVIDGIEYNYILKRAKYTRVPGDNQQEH